MFRSLESQTINGNSKVLINIYIKMPMHCSKRVCEPSLNANTVQPAIGNPLRGNYNELRLARFYYSWKSGVSCSLYN